MLNTTVPDTVEIDKLLKWIENQANSINSVQGNGMAVGLLFSSMDGVVSTLVGTLDDLTHSFQPLIEEVPTLDLPNLGELMDDLKGSVMALAEAAQEEVAEALEDLMGDAAEAAADVKDELEAQLGPLGDIGKELMNVGKQFMAVPKHACMHPLLPTHPHTRTPAHPHAYPIACPPAHPHWHPNGIRIAARAMRNGVFARGLSTT